MLKVLIGKPGSGKSYFAISEIILKSLSNNMLVLSNIKLSDNVYIRNYTYLDKNQIDSLNSLISQIMNNDVTNHDTKKHLLKKLFYSFCDSNLPFHSGLVLIIDEAHLYGYRSSRGETWQDDFISIHRHLFQKKPFDVWLITQVSSRLNSNISKQCEFAVLVKPSSSRYLKGFLSYTFYDSIDSLNKNDKFTLGSKTVKGDSEVFSLYESGFAMSGSNAFRRKLLILILGILLLSVFVFTRFSNLFSSKTYTGSDSVTVSHSSDKKNATQKDDNISNIIYDYSCTSYSLGRIVKNKNYSYKVYGKDSTSYCYKHIK